MKGLTLLILILVTSAVRFAIDVNIYIHTHTLKADSTITTRFPLVRAELNRCKMSTPIAQSSSYTEAELTRNSVKCKFNYRFGLFYSRGSFLVLIWNLLILITAVTSQVFLLGNLYSGWKTEVESILSILKLLLLMVFLVCTPLCGWLVDARFGKY